MHGQDKHFMRLVPGFGGGGRMRYEKFTQAVSTLIILFL